LASLRVPGGTIFSIGALTLFVIGLWIFPHHEGEQREEGAFAARHRRSTGNRSAIASQNGRAG
jgi:hypothetical protein